MRMRTYETMVKRMLMALMSALVLAGGLAMSARADETAYQQAISNLTRGENSLDLIALQQAAATFASECAGPSRDAGCEYYLARTYLALFTCYSTDPLPDRQIKAAQFLAKAEATAKLAIARRPSDPAPHVLMGRINQVLLLRNYVAGLTTAVLSESPVVAEYNRALALDPDNGEAELGLGIYYMSIPRFLGGDYQRARQYFRASAKDLPSDPEPLVWLSRAYRLEGRLGQARSALERARALAPTNYSVQVEDARLKEVEKLTGAPPPPAP
jgi:tetratricopeptide (TPR) repeat protein